MNKNILKITTMLSSLVLFPCISMAKADLPSDSNLSRTIGNKNGGNFKQINVNTGDNGEVISAGKDGVLKGEKAEVSKGTHYNKGSGVNKGTSVYRVKDGSDKGYVSKNIDVTKEGVTVEVQHDNYHTNNEKEKTVTMSDEQASVVHHHKKNEKVQNKKEVVKDK